LNSIKNKLKDKLIIYNFKDTIFIVNLKVT
jgi:hypothetical protein